MHVVRTSRPQFCLGILSSVTMTVEDQGARKNMSDMVVPVPHSSLSEKSVQAMYVYDIVSCGVLQAPLIWLH